MATTWDPANKGANITLGKANVMALGSVGWNALLGTSSHVTTGKYHIEFYCNSNGGDWIAGFGNSSTTLSNYPGIDTHSFGYQLNNSQIIYNNAYITSLWTVTASSGCVVAFELDFGAGLYWIKIDRAANWNNNPSADPATGTGGLTIPAVTGALFPVGGLGANSAITVNAGGFPFVFAPSSGFSAWDSSAVTFTGRTGASPSTWNPSDKNANVSLSGGDLVATRSATANTWGAVRSTTHYNGGGKIHFEFTITTLGSGGSPNLGFITGVGSSAASLSNFVGSDIDGIGCQQGNNDVWLNGSVIGAFDGGTLSAGDVYAVELDMNKGLWWIKNVTNATNWNNNASADPVAETLGFGIPQPDIYAMWSGQYTTSTADAVTVNFGASTFSQPLSTGYSGWDGTGGGATVSQSAVTVIT